jgi:large subunit ribosomal protein L23
MIAENVFIGPVVTEKSVRAQENGVYAFWVRSDATKIDVKRAMMQLYGRKVVSVQVAVLPKKERAAGKGKTITKRQEKKKVYVRFVDSSAFEAQLVKKVS